VFTVTQLIERLAVRDPDSHQAQIASHIDAVNVLGLTLDAEGRSEPLQGRAAIAWTVRNRREKYQPDLDKSYPEVCLRRLQYSCWWEVGGTPNFERTMLMAESIYGDPKAIISNWAKAGLKESMFVAQGVIQGVILDPVKGATHYLTRQLFDTRPPSWAVHDKVVAEIGNHVFLAGVK